MTAFAVGSLIAGLLATYVALQGVAESGVASDEQGTYVEAVDPTGFAWTAGIRGGQVIERIVASDEDGGWQLDTIGPDGIRHTASGRGPYAAVAASFPFGIVALVASGLAVLFLSTRRRWVAPAAALGLVAASFPLMFAGGPQAPTVVMAGAALVPVVLLVRRVRVGTRTRISLVAGTVVVLGAWIAARLNGAVQYAELESVRASLAFVGTASLVVDRSALAALRGESMSMVRPRLVDVAVLAASAAVALVAISALGASPFVIGALMVLLVIALPTTRRRIGRPLEDALLGDVRQAAAAEATETERARLARELHDVPLQELVAVIRRLEIKPGTEAESEDLRALAGHLRNVATELRPPVLDDLGLPAALDYLAEESTSSALPVMTDIVDDTGFGAGRRPPTDVELAMFRIASEAVGNALRHSGGSTIRIHGAVAPDHVEVVVTDDGSGLTSESAHDAAKRKRLGLASMRRRAEAIDAELSIDGTAHGTTVRVVWQA